MFEKLKENKYFKYVYSFGFGIYIITVNVLLIVILTVIIYFIIGKNINEIYKIALLEVKFVGGYQLALFVLGLPFILIHLSVEYGFKNKNRNVFKIWEFIFGTCIISIILIGLYIIGEGLSFLYKESITFSLIFLGAVTFSIYYWYKKKHSQ